MHLDFFLRTLQSTGRGFCFFNFTAILLVSWASELHSLLLPPKTHTLELGEDPFHFPYFPSNTFDYVIYFSARKLYFLFFANFAFFALASSSQEGATWVIDRFISNMQILILGMGAMVLPPSHPLSLPHIQCHYGNILCSSFFLCSQAHSTTCKPQGSRSLVFLTNVWDSSDLLQLVRSPTKR